MQNCARDRKVYNLHTTLNKDFRVYKKKNWLAMYMYNTFNISSSNCKTYICMTVIRKERYAYRRGYYKRSGSVIVNSLSDVHIYLDRIAP